MTLVVVLLAWVLPAVVFFVALFLVVKAAVRSALRENLQQELLRGQTVSRIEDGRDRPLQL